MTITRIGQDHWIQRGVRIERARRWADINQETLGSALGALLGRSYSRTAISNIEAGSRNINVDELRALAYLLGQSEGWLDGEEGTSFNERPLLHVMSTWMRRSWFGRPIDIPAAA